MKKRNKLFIYSCASILSLSILGFVLFVNKSFNSVLAEHTEHSGYHYQAKSATESESGWQEYWVCCECHQSFLAEPNGTFVDQEASNMVGGQPGPDHIAYVPKTIGDSKLLVVSDVHVTEDTNTQNHLRKTLQFVKNNDFDVVLFNGDLISVDDDVSYTRVDGIFEEVFGSVAVDDRPDFLFNMGNHEFYPTTACMHEETDYPVQQAHFFSFANKWMKTPITDNIYTRTIKGINYIIACPGPESMDGDNYLAAIGGYSSQDFADLKTYLDAATVNDQPVILGTHHPLGYTYGGSNYGMPSNSVVNSFKSLLANYPSIIHFTSHTHFSSLHERDLDQTNYTSVNVGMHCYGKYVSACEKDEFGESINYSNIESRRIVNDSQSQSQYGVTHFGINVNFADVISISRMNLATGTVYAHGTWTIPYGINKENMHDKFYYEAGERTGADMEFPTNTTLNATADVGYSSATIHVAFPDVTNYWGVEGYKVEVVGSTDLIAKRVWWQSMFWADLGHATSYSFDISGVKLDSDYTVNVYPMDFFGHYGEPISQTIHTSAERTSEDELELLSNDLFYKCDIHETSFNREGYSYDNKCTDTASVESGYSYKLSCDERGDGWPFITYELPESYDLSNSAISVDVKFLSSYRWFSIFLYDSNGTKVLNETGTDVSADSWSRQTLTKTKLQSQICEGKTLEDVKFIRFCVNFNNYSGTSQSVIFDNLAFEEISGYDFENITSSKTIEFSKIGADPIEDTANSNKAITFYTKTTTAFTFCLVASTGDRITSKNMIITIGDGTNPTITDVADGGWLITSVGNGVYYVCVRAGSITSNGSFGHMDAYSINFRERLPVTVANLAIKDYEAPAPSYHFDTYSSNTTIEFSKIGADPIEDTANSDKCITFYTKTTTAFTFCLVASTGDRITSKNMIITIGDGTNPTVTDVASGGWTIESVGDGVYFVSIRAGSITSNGSFGHMDAYSINFRERLPVTVANLAIV